MGLQVDKIRAMRFMGLVVGCLMVSGSGPIIAFNAYANPLKDKFNFTQTEVELCATLLNFGHKMGLPAGILQEYIGSRVLSGVAAGTSFTAWCLLYVSCLNTEAYSAGLIAVYFFLTGFGAISAFMSAVPINFNNFSTRQRGRVVSLLEGTYSIMPAFIAVIYSFGFTEGHGVHIELENLGGFFIFEACTWGCIFSLGIFFLNSYPLDKEKFALVEPDSTIEESDKAILNQEDAITSYETIKMDSPTQIIFPKNVSEGILDAIMESKYDSVWGWTVLKDLDFHLLNSGFLVSVGVQTLYVNNISSFLVSYMMFDKVDMYVIMAPIFVAIALFITGPLSDHLYATVPRFAFLLVAHVVQTISVLFLMLWGSSGVIMFLVLVGIESSTGVLFCISPTLISETYGVHYFGRNWGGILIGAAIMGAILQSIFGSVYDGVIEHSDTLYCFGPECFQKTLIVCLVLMCICLVLDVILIKRHIVRYRNYDKLLKEKIDKYIIRY